MGGDAAGEGAMMVEDVKSMTITDSVLFEDAMFVNVGYGIEDSGRAYPVMGESS